MEVFDVIDLIIYAEIFHDQLPTKNGNTKLIQFYS